MGSEFFTNKMIIKGSARDAYNQACDEMREINGHQEGYSGDIQTTYGFAMVKYPGRILGNVKFIDWMHEIADDTKRECFCVEITGAALKREKPAYLRGNRGIKGYLFFGWGAS